MLRHQLEHNDILGPVGRVSFERKRFDIFQLQNIKIAVRKVNHVEYVQQKRDEGMASEDFSEEASLALPEVWIVE